MLLPLLKMLLLLCLVVAEVAIQKHSSLANTNARKPQSRSPLEKERDRLYARQQFTRNFRDLQLTSQSLLKEHEEKRLNPQRLSKGARLINKAAKTLRSLMALGDLADPVKIDKEINTPQQFDTSIRRLAKLVYDFAHNPIHQSNKVFNTDQAQQAQTDLLAIIDLSKAIENKAKSYTFASAVQQ